MTTDRLHPPDSRIQLQASPTTDIPDVYAAFGLANYYGEVIGMLRFRFADDTWRALPYYGLGAMSYDPSLGIELNFHATLVRIRGRNLFPLFTLIGDHAVRWCWEADRAESLQSLEVTPVIERIDFGTAKTRGTAA
jgi:hypothetical protein